jgi:nucleotidyltransferase/DNA polymerase involved in DNA repair
MPAERNHILHVDMDAFYAAIEQLDHPEWRGQPVIVGAPPHQRGVVSTCSYEARVFGVRSAMPSRTAGKLCPHGIFTPPRMDRYVEVSRRLMALFEEMTPLVEPLSLDEAFLDVSGAPRAWGGATAIAETLRRRIRERLRLTGSVGVALNKFLAKVASDLHKPDGLTVVPETRPEILAFLAPLPVGKLWGVGKVSAQRLEQAGLRTIGDLQRTPPARLQALLGPGFAAHVRELAEGRDDRPVITDWDEKSISNENTFPEDVADRAEVWQMLLELTENVGARLRRQHKEARTAQIKLRFKDFRTLTRQTTFARPQSSDRALLNAARLLFEREPLPQPVRLIGFGVSNLVPAGTPAGEEQPTLFAEPVEPRPASDQRLDTAVDRLRDRFGDRALRRGDWRHAEPDEARPGRRPEDAPKVRRID